MIRWLRAILMLIGRLAIAAIFLSAAYNKITHWEESVKYMTSAGMTQVPIFLFLAILIELFGGIFLILGFKIRWFSAILALYLIPVTLIFHQFWSASAQDVEMQTINFLKNLAILGGLLYVVCEGAGFISLDRNRE